MVPDNKYGSYNKETKKWDGLVKHLLDRVSRVHSHPLSLASNLLLLNNLLSGEGKRKVKSKKVIVYGDDETVGVQFQVNSEVKLLPLFRPLEDMLYPLHELEGGLAN